MRNNTLKYWGLVFASIILLSCRTHETVSVHKNDIDVVETRNNSNLFLDLVLPNDNENQYKSLELSAVERTKNQYEFAYKELEAMLSGNSVLDFKRSVFLTENAYFNDSLDYVNYCQLITRYARICEKLVEPIHLKNYPYPDSLNMKKNFAIFTLLKDTTTINGVDLLPLQYNFESNSNVANWSSNFVSVLMKNGSGNCHSLPYLYKILANEIGAEAYLSLAPNHLYLKHRNKQFGWYNTELTSGQFPTDAWVKASGYVTIDAIRNGIYMDTLSQKQSIALCVYDLAMGYSKKTGNITDGFIIKCCNLALKYHSQNINAIILKAETLKKNYDLYVQQHDLKNANETFSTMRNLYVQGIQLGYREMPKEMYLAWLQSSIEGNEKYHNAAVNKTLNTISK